MSATLKKQAESQRKSKTQQNIDLNLLRKLSDDGILKKLFDQGILSWKILFYLDVFNDYDISLKKGSSKMDAVYETAMKFNIDITTVYRIIRRFGYEFGSINTDDKGPREIFGSSNLDDL